MKFYKVVKTISADVKVDVKQQEIIELVAASYNVLLEVYL